MSILIKNGRVLNPSENLDSVMDILIDKGVIVKKLHILKMKRIRL